MYYRVAAADLAAVVDAVRALQQDLRTEFPGLQAELLRRPGTDANGAVTLMEVYVLPPGLDGTALEVRTAACSARWLQGSRHVERFEALA